MKLSITDQFLWDVYRIVNKTGDVVDFLLNPRAIKFMPGEKDPIFEKYKNIKNKRKFNDLIYYLKTNGYIKVKSLESKRAIILTKEGVGKVLKASFKIEKQPRRKDGKWIMLMYDLPQENRKTRTLLRSILFNLGYKMFQQSVWITPYDVSEKTEKLLQLYSFEQYVKIFLIEEI